MEDLLDNKKNEIFKALAVFRANVKQPQKNADNPFFKSKYVQLEGVVDAIDKATPGTGLSYYQDVQSGDNEVLVTTVITHSSGQYIQLGPLAVPVAKKDAQAFGSAETYARRYALSAAFGITSDVDDDGNAAAQTAPRQTAQRPQRPQPRQQPQPKPAPRNDAKELVKLVESTFTLLPTKDKAGNPRPKTTKEFAESLIGLANANTDSKATTISELTPKGAQWMKVYLEKQSAKLAGGDGE